MKSKFLITLISGLIFAVLSGGILTDAIEYLVNTEVNSGWVTGGLVVASILPKPAGVMFMALDVELWKPWIIGNLFKATSS